MRFDDLLINIELVAKFFGTTFEHFHNLKHVMVFPCHKRIFEVVGLLFEHTDFTQNALQYWSDSHGEFLACVKEGDFQEIPPNSIRYVSRDLPRFHRTTFWPLSQHGALFPATS